ALVPDIRSCSKQGIKQQFGEVLGGGYKPGASDGNIRCSLFFCPDFLPFQAKSQKRYPAAPGTTMSPY
ncbi:MAG: hypothetical protein LAO18_16410, partial [Acidobacteriia bacterium]|nr:hypothetical protein [Terriglobia bacterium]